MSKAMARALDTAGLSERQQVIIRERLVGRSYREIAGTACSRQRVQQLEREALARLGLPAAFSLEALHADERAERAGRMLENGRRVLTGELSNRDVARRARQRLGAREVIQGQLERLADRILKEAEREDLSGERLAYFEAQSDRLARALAALG
jgi:hypothetical protein